MAKIALQDFVKYGKLFEVYGNLLSDDRQKIVSMYFEYNMTLAEIAKERNISRQAVLDAIDKSCQKLEELEAKLQIVKKNEKFADAIKDIALDNTCSAEIRLKVEKILKDI